MSLPDEGNDLPQAVARMVPPPHVITCGGSWFVSRDLCATLLLSCFTARGCIGRACSICRKNFTGGDGTCKLVIGYGHAPHAAHVVHADVQL